MTEFGYFVSGMTGIRECVHCVAVRGDRDSAVGVATSYGLDGSRIESLRPRDIQHASRSALCPIQIRIHLGPGLSQEESGRGVALSTFSL
jgi:hypothetical protein